MAIQVRRENDQPKTTQAIAPHREMRWDPFRMLRELASWDPFHEMQAFTPELAGGMLVNFEVKETNDGYVFKADVPGMKENDINVLLTGNRLTISGKREAEREEKGDTYYCYERTYGDFRRSFTLPEGVDPNTIHADLKDGVLTVGIHKTPELQSKKIPVQTPAKKS
ncbi:MAG TPA: Hsp20/alpha crystallin family protein [Minicystis sp.]|nr:Hsp20/alpha crystallin family protein [Minicystis sp.]